MVVVAFLSLSGKGRAGRLFEAGRLLTFSASRMGAYSRWALIRGWALIRINTVVYIYGHHFYEFDRMLMRKNVNNDFSKDSPIVSQGPEEMCLSLENQNPSKTSEKMGYFESVTVSLHIL